MRIWTALAVAALAVSSAGFLAPTASAASANASGESIHALIETDILAPAGRPRRQAFRFLGNVPGARRLAMGETGAHMLLLTEQGAVWAWGQNEAGQLGVGDYEPHSGWTRVEGLEGAVAIAAGAQHSAAVLADGSLWTWGANDQGQLGEGTLVGRVAPARVASLNGVVSIVAGKAFTLAATAAGEVWAFGSNWNDVVPGDAQRILDEPVLVPGLAGVKALAVFDNQPYAKDFFGRTMVWGTTGQPGAVGGTPVEMTAEISDRMQAELSRRFGLRDAVEEIDASWYGNARSPRRVTVSGLSVAVEDAGAVTRFQLDGPVLDASVGWATAWITTPAGSGLSTSSDGGDSAGTLKSDSIPGPRPVAAAAGPGGVSQGAAAFRTINSVKFVKKFGGADPLPQTLTLASSGVNFDFKVSVSTNSGGSWLSYTGCGSYCNTPQGITFYANPSVAQAAGTYTGQIVFTEYFNTFSMTVPVTLVIAPVGGAFFDDLPGQMSFVSEVNTTPPSREIQIRNGGPGSLAWTVSKSTSDGGNWLQVSANSGTAPSRVTVSIVTSALPDGGLLAGDYVGELVFQTASGNVTVPIGVRLGNGFQQVNSLSFMKLYGGADPLPQVLGLGHVNTSFDFRVAAHTANGGDWLSVSGCGSYCNTPQAITVSVNPLVTLPAGTYTGELIFTEYYYTFALTVPVTLVVASPGSAFFSDTQGQMSFTLETSSATPTPQTLQLRNGSAGALNWTMTKMTADGGNWLNVSAASGSTPSNPVVSIVPTQLPGLGLIAGSFTGLIQFRTNTGDVTVPVSVVVGTSLIRQISPLSFNKVFSGQDPLPQVISAVSPGAALDFRATAYTGNGGNWLSVSGCGSYCNTPQALIVAVAPSVTLPVGTYTGEIVLTEYYYSLAVTIPVTLTVGAANAPIFGPSPGQLSFTMLTGGAAPAVQPVNVRNAGGGALPWTLTKYTSDGGNWLNVSSTTGWAPSQVNVGITPGSLPGLGLIAGTYTGKLVFETNGSRMTIPVSVTVGASVFQEEPALFFSKAYGGSNPVGQALSIGSTGTNIDFRVSTSTANGGNWLTVTGCGSYCTTPRALTATVNPVVTLPEGIYTGQIVLTEYYYSMSLTIPVTLVIGNPVDSQVNRVGLYNNGTWRLDLNANGLLDDAPYAFNAGPSATRLVGDWDGDGRDEIGLFINGFWYLDYNGNGAFGAGDKQFQFGWNGVTPFVGDWNGDGTDTIGFFINGFWYLDANGDGLWDGGVVDMVAEFGWTGVTPFVGDWNADGRDKIGIYYNGFWYLDKNGNRVYDGPVTDFATEFGWAPVTPLVGDWNGDGTDTIGIYYNGFWYLDANGNGVWNGPGVDISTELGFNGVTPIIADWNGDGRDKIGIFIDGFWYLDYDGTATWDNGLNDRAYDFGATGDIPTFGRW